MEMWHEFCCKFLGEYDSERTLKIGQHSSQMREFIVAAGFLTHCIVIITQEMFIIASAT